jgi:alpha-beta hydrolase superfamily lysophospholipase
MRFRNRIKAKDLSRDLAYVKAYQNDVYNHNKISARLALDIYRNGKYAMTNIDKLDLPVLLMHGTSDRVTPASVSKTIAEKAGNMVNIRLWENGYHELHNDIQKEIVIRKMIEWLKKEIKS